MTIDNFRLRPEQGAPDERELWLEVSPDYETPADRLQRGVIVASRAETDSVTAKTIQRGFVLRVTDVQEAPAWTPPTLPTITLQVPSDLSAVSHVADYTAAAADPEGQAWDMAVGIVPTGITAIQGTGEPGSKFVTYTFGAQASNPSSDQTFQVPLSLLQNNVAVPDSAINQTVIVRRYAPHAISSAYTFIASPGVIGIVATGVSFSIDVTHFVQNPDSRPLLADNGTNGTTTWRSSYADYALTLQNGRWIWQGTRSPTFGDDFSTDQVDAQAIRIRTNDNGDTSTVTQHWQVHVDAP